MTVAEQYKFMLVVFLEFIPVDQASPATGQLSGSYEEALKGAQSRLKSLAKLFKFVVCNPCQSSPSLTILVPLWFIIISLMFFYLYKVFFLGFLQFNGYFFAVQNNSRCRD